MVPVFLSFVLTFTIVSRYGELQGLNKKETADKYGTDMVTKWRRSYDIPPPNGESLAMCAERAVAYFKDNVEPQLKSGKNVLIAAHGNSLRAIIMYLDSLTSQEVGEGNNGPHIHQPHICAYIHVQVVTVQWCLVCQLLASSLVPGLSNMPHAFGDCLLSVCS